MSDHTERPTFSDVLDALRELERSMKDHSEIESVDALGDSLDCLL